MKTSPPPPVQYRQLQRQLARLGYLSQGSVFERAPDQQGSRYVWTRKVQAKTVTVALSQEQYYWLKQAIANQREMQRIVEEMQTLSRQILFETVPGVTRRKRLGKKVLGLSIIEIHDSRVVEIRESDGSVIVHFRPAYLHKSQGRPAIDSGTGWVQEARLIFSEASVSGSFPDWPCTIMDGEIILGGARHRNLIPVPLEVAKLTELRLICDSVHTVTVKGQAVRLELAGEPRFVEEFPGHEPKKPERP